MYMKKITAIAAAALLVTGCEKAKMQSGPVQPGATQEVRLIWKAGLNQWKVQLNGGPEKNPNEARTTLAQGAGPTMFIVDIAGHPATFRNPGGLTVWEGAKSGPQGSDQIVGPVVIGSGKRMIFFDLNKGQPVTLFYSLNLSDGQSVDPIIDNGGGSGV